MAGQANLLDKQGQIINGGRALTTDSVSSLFAGLVGASPVAGLLFFVILFMSPLAWLAPGLCDRTRP